MTSPAEFFDNLAARWDENERPDIRARIDRVVHAAEIGPGMTVLDVGCGTGVLIPSLLVPLAGQGRVVAIDISAGMLAVALGKGFPATVEFRQADLLQFSAPAASFDRVMMNAVFPHFTDQLAALKRAWELLKPGGQIVVSHPVGREVVNRAHLGSSSPQVRRALVPSLEAIDAMYRDAGFTTNLLVDEPEFYLASAFKR